VEASRGFTHNQAAAFGGALSPFAFPIAFIFFFVLNNNVRHPATTPTVQYNEKTKYMQEKWEIFLQFEENTCFFLISIV
jgi:hypothetical protein